MTPAEFKATVLEAITAYCAPVREEDGDAFWPGDTDAWVLPLANALGVPLAPLTANGPNFDPKAYLGGLVDSVAGQQASLPVFVSEILMQSRNRARGTAAELGYLDGTPIGQLKYDMMMASLGYYVGIMVQRSGLETGITGLTQAPRKD